jgi:aminoglycoside phosphotransferase (APT) family kinase protein
MVVTDQAKEIRNGEELDTAAIEAFLKEQVPELSGPVAIKQFPGGHSNLTYLITVGDRELVLRRPPFGTKAKTAHDMGREYKILSALQPVYPYGPKPLAYTEDPSVMGCPFYVMDRIKGIILRKDLPPELSFNEDEMNRLCRNLLDTHLELHQVDYKSIGLGDFGKPEGYVRRQVEGWSKRYRNARTPDAPDCEATMAWLLDKMPPDCPKPGVIHNDFKFDNVVLDPQNPLNIIGVLDWEMATIGDPLMDLGGSLAYWTEKDDHPEMQAMRFMPTHLPGALTRKEIVDIYSQKSGLSMSDHYDFYYCFGLFRLAVIAQQIYYRFYHGQTKDKRFKAMIMGVLVLENQAQRVIAASNL